MVSGVPIDDKTSTALYAAACRMFDGGGNRKKISGPTFEGVLTTEFEYVSFGTIGGTRFVAEIDSIQGKTKVAFVVHDRDLKAMLEKGVWSPCEIFVENEWAGQPSPSAYVN